jgi:hypothetical protein
MLQWAFKALLILLCGSGLFWVSFGAVNARVTESVTTLTCATDSCQFDLPIPMDKGVWAPGSEVRRKLVVKNESTAERVITVRAEEVKMSSPESIPLIAQWQNGSHRVIWQGNIGEATIPITLTTIPAHSRRVFHYRLSLAEDAPNSASGVRVSARWTIGVTDAQEAQTAPFVQGAMTSKLAAIITQPPLVFLVQSLGYTLPGLSYAPTELNPKESTAPTTVLQTVLPAARKMGWIVWALMAMEVLALQPWNLQRCRLYECGLLALGSGASVWLVSASWTLTGLAVLLPVMWWSMIRWQIGLK